MHSVMENRHLSQGGSVQSEILPTPQHNMGIFRINNMDQAYSSGGQPERTCVVYNNCPCHSLERGGVSSVACSSKCLIPEILENYQKLRSRHSSMFTKRKRISELAEPNLRQARRPSLSLSSLRSNSRSARIVRSAQPLSNSRTQQLSYPRVCQLMCLKSSSSYQTFSDKRRQSVDRMLSHSYLSLYSHLSKIKDPGHNIEPKKRTPEEKIEHYRRIKQLAKSRVELKAVTLPKKPKPVQQVGVHPTRIFRRSLGLAKPKTYVNVEMPAWRLKQQQRHYVPSRRLEELAMPKEYAKWDEEDVYSVKKTAFEYKATPRIKELALPSRHRLVQTGPNEHAFATSLRALNAKPTARIEELAQPRVHFPGHAIARPYAVRRAALRARTTERLRHLALPKNSPWYLKCHTCAL